MPIFLVLGLAVLADLAFFIGFELGVEFRGEANINSVVSLVDDYGCSEFCEPILAHMKDCDYDSWVGSIDEPGS